MWGADLLLLLILLWRFLEDRWESLNMRADRIEQGLPPWFRWEERGDWITWIHHTLWAGLLTGVGALLGWATEGSAYVGALHFSILAALFYVVREWYGFYLDREVTLDGLMDQVGPLLIVLNLVVWR